MNKYINIIKERFIGIVKTPTLVLGDLMNNKKWQGVLAFLLISAFILSFLTGPIILKLNFEKNPELYSSFSGSIGLMGKVLMGMSGVFLYVMRLIFVTFFIYLFYSVFGAEGVFSNYFSLVVNSSLITLFIPELLRSIYLLITGNVVQIFSLATYIGNVEKLDLMYFVFSVIDFFQIWFIFLIAYGVYGFYKNTSDKWEEQKFTQKKSFIIALTYFIFKSVVVILFSYLLAKFAASAQQMLINS